MLKLSPVPILQGPMAGAQDSALAIAVCKAGGLGALPAAMLTPQVLRAQIAAIRAATDAPFNVNFFAHRQPADDPAAQARWLDALRPYYREFGVDEAEAAGGAGRAPFDEGFCALVEELRPPVVSFHFGLPAPELLERVKKAGCFVLSSATTVAEARWLEANGADAVIAQGAEAGGHRATFLTPAAEMIGAMAMQPGLFALLPQVVDAVKIPVVAAGAVGDGRSIAAAFALGASAVQIGTAFLRATQATTSAAYRARLAAPDGDDATVLTNLITGRPARGFVNRLMRELGPLSPVAPAFATATAAVAPLKAAAEKQGRLDFTHMWSGQAPVFARELDAGEIVRELWADAQARGRDFGKLLEA